MTAAFAWFSSSGAMAGSSWRSIGSPGEYEPVLKRTTTQLNHSSGTGLRIIRWGIDELGGERDFESDADGATVKLRIPTDN